MSDDMSHMMSVFVPEIGNHWHHPCATTLREGLVLYV
jgi:hypothetical protein